MEKPDRAYQSGGLTPAARTRISTSPGPGTGRGTSSYVRTSGPPCLCTLIAFTGSSRYYSEQCSG
ncbi:hypothetical protein GCM10009558_024070 [Virgisporangium aurantiacum]